MNCQSIEQWDVFKRIDALRSMNVYCTDNAATPARRTKFLEQAHHIPDNPDKQLTAA